MWDVTNSGYKQRRRHGKCLEGCGYSSKVEQLLDCRLLAISVLLIFVVVWDAHIAMD